MKLEEVEIVAEELAKVGGTSWYPGRETGPLLRVVSDRYRDRARTAIAALDRFRALQASSSPSAQPAQDEPSASSRSASSTSLEIGSIVVYRPPGDQRAYPCRVEKIQGGQIYITPIIKACTGWIPVEHTQPIDQASLMDSDKA
jgi:hypothetical protein